MDTTIFAGADWHEDFQEWLQPFLASHRVSLVPMGRDDASGKRLVSVDQFFQAGESSEEWAELRECLDEGASTLRSGIEDAELALRVVEPPVTLDVPRRESAWIWQPADAVEHPRGVRVSWTGLTRWPGSSGRPPGPPVDCQRAGARAPGRRGPGSSR